MVEQEMSGHPSSKVGNAGLPGTSVEDLDVFGPPGYGSVSTRYGSGSFYHQAKIVKKKHLDSYFYVTSL
jgi:hypothetical protein